MTARVFFDTSVLVYAAVGTGSDDWKRRRALALVESEDFGTSAQVLQEFFVTVVRKASRPLPWDAAILAAAEALGAATVYSEDLNGGRRYGSVRVVNPFR